MRQKLNENPVAQIAVVCVLIAAAAFLLLTRMGGGSEAPEEPATASASIEAAPVEAGAEAPVEGSIEAAAAGAEAVPSTSVPTNRSLPSPVEDAYERGSTLAVLVYRDGGIDDHLVSQAADVLRGIPAVAFFAVKASQIARFAPITGPLGIEEVPALIVVRPRALNGAAPAPASVTYGFQRERNVRQAVRDAVYHGPQLTYAPN